MAASICSFVMKRENEDSFCLEACFFLSTTKPTVMEHCEQLFYIEQTFGVNFPDIEPSGCPTWLLVD